MATSGGAAAIMPDPLAIPVSATEKNRHTPMRTDVLLIPCALLAAAAALAAPRPAGSAAACESASPVPAALVHAAAESYKIDPVHSFLLFRIQHLGLGVAYGRFDGVAGSFTMDAEDPSRSAVEVEVKAESVDTGVSDRDNHLRGPDFFNAKQFPTIAFKSTKIERVADRRVKVTGDLSLHGVTRRVTVEVDQIGAGKDPWGNWRSGFEATFTVKRSDFGMTYMPEGLGDEVKVMLGIEGIRQ